MSSRASWRARPMSEVLCKFVRINCGAKISVVRSRAKQPFSRQTKQSARRPTYRPQLPWLQTRRVNWGIRRRAPPSELRRSGSCVRVSVLPLVGRLSPERVSVARSAVRPALHRSVQLDLSPERVSVARSAVRPALHRSVQRRLSPERVSVARSAVRPALDRSVQLGLSPERVSVARSAVRPALHQSVQLDLSPECVSVARSAVRPALDQSASGVESDKLG